MRRGASSPAGWLGFVLAGALLLIPWASPDWEPAWANRLELSAPEPELPTQLVIEAPLLAKLRTLAEGLHAEIALCLFGTVEGDTARVGEFHMPEPTLSTASKSLVRPCPAGTLAVWHNHPISSRAFSSLGPWRRADRPRQARHLCVLSKTDIQTSVRFDHAFVIVGVDRDTWCWWTRAEVEELAREGSAPGLPAPEKLVTAGAASKPPVARRATQAERAQDASPHGLGAPR